MSTDLNPYKPPQEADYAQPAPWSEPEEGELGVILLIVKGVSITLGGLLFFLMTIWWISTLMIAN